MQSIVTVPIPLTTASLILDSQKSPKENNELSKDEKPKAFDVMIMKKVNPMDASTLKEITT